jgi:replicative DNA helicase
MNPEFPLERPTEERFLVGLLLPPALRTLRDEALQRVDPEHFGTMHYGGMWAAAQRLRANEQLIDRRSLLAEIRTEVGGQGVPQILDSLIGYTPTTHEYPNVIREVINAGKLRRLVETLGRAQQRAYTAEDPDAAYAVALEELERLADRREEAGGVTHLSAIMDGLAEDFRNGLGDKAIPSPWPDFNERAAGGFHRGRLHVIGARPGEGKSIAGHQAALYAAAHGRSAVIFSMEMSNAEVGGRMLANDSRVEMNEVAKLQLSEDSWRRYNEFTERSRDMPLWVIDRSNMTVELISSIARTHKRRHGLDVMCVDYLQLMGMKGVQSREQAVSEIARRLKNLARELDCAVLLPSQLNRETARRGKPSLADLRESGGIEAHADLVLLLARQRFPENHDTAPGKYNGRIVLDIAKNRFGQTGDIELDWRGHYATIG